MEETAVDPAWRRVPVSGLLAAQRHASDWSRLLVVLADQSWLSGHCELVLMNHLQLRRRACLRTADSAICCNHFERRPGLFASLDMLKCWRSVENTVCGARAFYGGLCLLHPFRRDGREGKKCGNRPKTAVCGGHYAGAAFLWMKLELRGRVGGDLEAFVL